MKIIIATVLIGFFISSSSGNYSSSKNTRCRSECRRDNDCPLGLTCEAIPKDGCRVVYECVRAINPSVVDPSFPVGVRGEKVFKGDLVNVVPSNIGRGGPVAKIPVGSGLNGKVGDGLTPVLVPKGLGPIRGDNYVPGDIKTTKNAGDVINDPFLGGVAPGNPFVPVDKLQLNNPVSEVNKFSLDLCIDDCLMRTTCLQGTNCRLVCQDICLEDQAAKDLGPIVGPLNRVPGIVDSFLPINKVVKSPVNGVKVGSGILGSSLGGPIVKPIDAYPSGQIGKQGIVASNDFDVDPFTGEIISSINVDGSVVKGHGSLLADKGLVPDGLGIVKPVLPGGGHHDLGLNKAGLLSLDKVVNPLTGQVSVVESQGLIDPLVVAKNTGGFINTAGSLGFGHHDDHFSGKNVPIVDPLLKEKSSLLVDSLGQTHSINSERKALDVLIPTNPRDCFKECNRDGQCKAFGYGICRQVGCKRVCEYPDGDLHQGQHY